MGKLLDLFNRVLTAKYLHTTPNQGSYAYEIEGSTLYLLFEKSNGDTDWSNNFKFPAKPYRDMGITWYAHSGFLTVWKEIEPYLAAVIRQPEIKKIIISGYSHGGAIAALAHEYVWFNRPDLRHDLETYAFGAPRVFWGFYIPDILKERWATFTVIRNGRDTVTYLPPVMFGYRHVGKILHINKDREILVDEPFKTRCINEHYHPNIIAALEVDNL